MNNSFASGGVGMETIDKDYEYMKSLYPKAARRIQQEVEEQCDKLEYEGSFMFDQYPDPVHLHVMADAIYESLKNIASEEAAISEMSLGGSCYPGYSCRESWACGPGRHCPPPRPDYRYDGSPDWFKGLIDSTLYNEMFYRRMRYRNRRGLYW